VFENVLRLYPHHASALGGLAALGGRLVDDATFSSSGAAGASAGGGSNGKKQQQGGGLITIKVDSAQAALDLPRGLALLEAAVATPTVANSAAGDFARQKLATYHAARGMAFAAHAGGGKTPAAVAAFRLAVQAQGGSATSGNGGSGGGFMESKSTSEANAERVGLLCSSLCRMGSDELRERGDAHAAKKCYEEALALKPGLHAALRGLADAHMRHGVSLAAEGGNADAAREFKKALQRKGGNLAEAHHQLGKVYEAQGKPGEAKASHTEALAQDPGLDEARFSLRALVAKLDETTGRCKLELKARPRDSELWHKLGVTAVASGRQIDGAQAFQRCLELNPKHAGALQGYGETLETMGRFKASADAYAKVGKERGEEKDRDAFL
jgi:tetratricopeptide (TPR) repeat protein